MPGVRKVIEMPQPKPPYGFQPWGGLAVVADHTWAAMRGRAALDVTWDPGPNGTYDSDKYRESLSKAVSVPGTVARKVGDTESALKTAARRVEAEYHVPHLPHMQMEPVVSVASVTGNSCEVWAPTQNPQGVQTEVGADTGDDERKGSGPRDFSGWRLWAKVEGGLQLRGCISVAADGRTRPCAIHPRRRRPSRLRKHSQHQSPDGGTRRKWTRNRLETPDGVPFDFQYLRRAGPARQRRSAAGCSGSGLAVPNVTR